MAPALLWGWALAFEGAAEVTGLAFATCFSRLAGVNGWGPWAWGASIQC